MSKKENNGNEDLKETKKLSKDEKLSDRVIKNDKFIIDGFAEGYKIANRYHIKEQLGKGAFGIVYKCYDEMLDRLVAVKVLFSNIMPTKNINIKELFLSEARTIAKLDHINIVPVFDAGFEENAPWIAMKLISGYNLEYIISNTGKLNLNRAVKLTTQALNALSYAHKKGIIHRDIKPSNFIIEQREDGSENLYLADFGIAKILSDKTMTLDKFIVGTPSYMSPEQLAGRKIDARSDLFAMGCVLYEMLTGDQAFAGESFAEITHKIIHEHPAKINELDVIAGGSIKNIIRKSLAKSPQDRYQNAEEMLSDLNQLLIANGYKKKSIISSISKFFRPSSFYKLDEEYSIIVENLWKGYKYKNYVLKGINLKIKRASIYALLGRNGSGKTTLIRTIMGFLQPDKGIVRILGRSPLKENHKILQRVGYVPENITVYDWLKVGELISFLKHFYPNWDDNYCYYLLGKFNISINEKIKDLSKGMKTKISLIHALSHRPELLILDDPTIGLDAVILSEVFEIIKEASIQWGSTIFLASHNLQEVEEAANEVGFIKDGKIIITDTIKNLKIRTREVQVTFRDEIPKIEIDKLKIVKSSGRRITAIILDTNSGALEKLKAYHPEEIKIRELSLKEIFINFMR